MNAEVIRSLYEYTEWANQRVLNAAAILTSEEYHRDFEYAWGTLHRTLTHTYAVEWLAVKRVQGVSPPAMPDTADVPDRTALQMRWAALNAERRDYLHGLTDDALVQIIMYTTTQGEEYSNLTWQILTHAVNHSTEHRSQAAWMLTTLGQPPPSLGLIAFYRGE
jgi:uncharacterized damage-inducible protein DinB